MENLQTFSWDDTVTWAEDLAPMSVGMLKAVGMSVGLLKALLPKDPKTGREKEGAVLVGEDAMLRDRFLDGLRDRDLERQLRQYLRSAPPTTPRTFQEASGEWIDQGAETGQNVVMQDNEQSAILSEIAKLREETGRTIESLRNELQQIKLSPGNSNRQAPRRGKANGTVRAAQSGRPVSDFSHELIYTINHSFPRADLRHQPQFPHELIYTINHSFPRADLHHQPVSHELIYTISHISHELIYTINHSFPRADLRHQPQFPHELIYTINHSFPNVKTWELEAFLGDYQTVGERLGNHKNYVAWGVWRQAAKLIAALSSLEEKAKACQHKDLPTFSAVLNEAKGYMYAASFVRQDGKEAYDEAVANKFAAVASHAYLSLPTRLVVAKYGDAFTDWDSETRLINSEEHRILRLRRIVSALNVKNADEKLRNSNAKNLWNDELRQKDRKLAQDNKKNQEELQEVRRELEMLEGNSAIATWTEEQYTDDLRKIPSNMALHITSWRLKPYNNMGPTGNLHLPGASPFLERLAVDYDLDTWDIQELDGAWVDEVLQGLDNHNTSKSHHVMLNTDNRYIRLFEVELNGVRHTNVIAVLFRPSIDSQEDRRCLNEILGNPEHPWAASTDDVECFFSLLHHKTGEQPCTLKEFKYCWRKLVMQCRKRMDTNLPFYYWTLNERYTVDDYASFDVPPEAVI
ncbi:hypothetical protein Bbelb_049550 [Branchiostoma belcheri]|nr:hypothetical protein Bbelb_049550 [Branchiostoma belcheri]